MIDFTNHTFDKLRPEHDNGPQEILAPFLAGGEVICHSFYTSRDYVVFTDRRLVLIDRQGLAGKRKVITTLPYRRLLGFTAETVGVLDGDSRLELNFQDLGELVLEFVARSDLESICKTMAATIL